MQRWNRCENVLKVHNVGNLRLKWSTPIVGGDNAAPAVADGLVYVGGPNLHALDARTGAKVWELCCGGDYRVDSSPAVANRVVYVGALGGKVFARWTPAPASCSGATQPAVQSVVVAGRGERGGVMSDQDDHNVHALDAKTGAKLWSYDTGADRVFSSPAVVNGVVYVGSIRQQCTASPAAGCQHRCQAVGPRVPQFRTVRLALGGERSALFRPPQRHVRLRPEVKDAGNRGRFQIPPTVRFFTPTPNSRCSSRSQHSYLEGKVSLTGHYTF